MATITLSAGDDLVQRLSAESDPVRAVTELVWNGLDADADRVGVTFERNDAGGIIGVTIRDDGNGMSPERIDHDFRWVGNSWKRGARTSENKGRPMHGRFGQGRLRAFALGAHVRWTTVAKDAEQKFKRSVISSSIDHRTDFAVSSVQDVEGPTFTEFTAQGRDGLNKLDSATQDADGWVLTGQKCFVTNANVADDLLVIARTGAGSGYFALTAFVVPTTLPGITVGPNHLTHQLRGATVADIHLDGVRVQASALLGGVGAGASVFRHAMAWERVCLFAAYIGAMCGVLDETAHYVEQRLQFGHALSHQQRVRHTLAELALEVESARGLLYRAAAALDRSEPEADRLGEMAKVAVSTTATTVGLRCTELQGAHGVFWSRAAQLVSDAVPALVFSGATHVQLNNIAASLGVGTA